MAKWVCNVCGYVYEGDAAPETCPVCKAPASKFTKQDAEMTWAAEHVVGVAQGVSEDIVADLRANFQGECSEVGMYLAMARVAHREGYLTTEVLNSLWCKFVHILCFQIQNPLAFGTHEMTMRGDTAVKMIGAAKTG